MSKEQAFLELFEVEANLKVMRQCVENTENEQARIIYHATVLGLLKKKARLLTIVNQE